MENKKPLILLPGLLCDSALWTHQIRHLDDLADIAVPDLTRDDSVGGMAQRVLESAPPTFALAGLSMGGYVAFEILRRAPERVSQLCLVNTSARPDTPEQTRVRRGLISLAKKGSFKGVTPRLLPTLIHPDRVEEPELADVIMSMAERVGQEAFIRQETAIVGRPDSRPLLASIHCPTLVIGGRQDEKTPLDGHYEMAEGIPGARMAVIEDCAHLAPLERPQATTALMRLWLRYG